MRDSQQCLCSDKNKMIPKQVIDNCLMKEDKVNLMECKSQGMIWGVEISSMLLILSFNNRKLKVALGKIEGSHYKKIKLNHRR